MRTRDSFGEAMTAVRRLCLSGALGAGDPLVVSDIASAVRLSATPVREALAWLAGQGLIERRIGRGYAMPDLSAAEVAQLYGLHRRYLVWALECPDGFQNPEPCPRPDDPVERTAWLFRRIAADSGDAALADAQARASARLRLLRRAERQVLQPDTAALDAAEAAIGDGHRDVLREFVDHHHQERIRSAARISAVLHQTMRNIEQI